MTDCRIMETRTCPPAGPCSGPCARFESDDPTPWVVLRPPTPNPLQPDHMICGEVHCDPCNRMDRQPAT